MKRRIGKKVKRQRGREVLPFNLLAFGPLLGINPESLATGHPSSVALKTVASPNANAYLAITSKLVFLHCGGWTNPESFPRAL